MGRDFDFTRDTQAQTLCRNSQLSRSSYKEAPDRPVEPSEPHHSTDMAMTCYYTTELELCK
jgi:hypothetical protein